MATVIAKTKATSEFGSWITISKALQEADLRIYKEKEDRHNKQILWKCGARRFKFK